MSKLSTKMKEAPLAFVDLETTGLELEHHEIIEIGVVVVEQPSLNVIYEEQWKILPTHIETADPVALKINKYDKKVWDSEGVELSKALSKFAEATSGAVMVAHNVAFDAAFLKKSFEEQDIKNKMDYHRLDTISIAFAKLHDIKKIQKFSLRALCEHFGIENKKAHTALSDARATYELYRKLMS